MEILFICKYNAGRSRMAEAFFNKFLKKNCAKGRGISPYTRLNSNYKGIKGTVTVMKEEGLAVSSKLGIPVTKKNVGEADRMFLANRLLHLQLL